MSTAADRGRELARQAHYNAVARTRLNMSLHHLEIGLAAARNADMGEAEAFEQAIWTQTNLLHSWPQPVRDQSQAVAS
jgi:hypothetical protein